MRALALLLACGVGVADELYQQLAPGRIPSVGDVVADSLGAAIGIALFATFRAIRYRVREEEQQDGDHTKLSRQSPEGR